MIKVYIKKRGNFPISTLKLKKAISEFFISQGIVSDADVNVLIVGKKQMDSLGKKFLSKNESLHNVLSFVTNEAKKPFIEAPDKIIHLGDIAVCYPVAVKEAASEGVLTEKKVIELMIHGAYHLLGKHHE